MCNRFGGFDNIFFLEIIWRVYCESFYYRSFFYILLYIPQIQFPLNLKWTPGHDMSFAMTDYIQSVTVQEMMYVGRGYASSINNRYIVMTYNVISQEWSQLPQYIARYFATVIHNKLTLVGGCRRNDRDTDTLGVWDANGRK